MKVTIAQINTTNGDIAGNTSKNNRGDRKGAATARIWSFFPNRNARLHSQDWFQDADIIEHALDPLER